MKVLCVHPSGLMYAEMSLQNSEVFGVDGIELLVHLVLEDVLGFYRSEGSGPHVKCNRSEFVA